MGIYNDDPKRLKQILANLPTRPGVYLMRNAGGEIIYVGKSRSLKNRVRSYFTGKLRDAKTAALIEAVADIEFIVTETEIEALILENNLIKRHRPRYNIMLKDSKTHPYLRITLAEEFPRIEKVRRVSFRDGNAYFGPFPDEGGLNRIVDLLSRTLKLCNSKKPLRFNRLKSKADKDTNGGPNAQPNDRECVLSSFNQNQFVNEFKNLDQNPRINTHTNIKIETNANININTSSNINTSTNINTNTNSSLGLNSKLSSSSNTNLNQNTNLQANIDGKANANKNTNSNAKVKACLRYHLGLCHGVCIGAVSAEEYRKAAGHAVEILSGRAPLNLDSMRQQMKKLAEEFRYEEAAELRDTILALENFFRSQKVELTRAVDLDLWGVAESPDLIVVSVFFVRAGKLLGHRIIEVEREPASDIRSLLGTLMMQFYEKNLIPQRIVVEPPPTPLISLQEYLKRLCGHNVRFGTARRGPLHKLLCMAGDNAREVLRNRKSTGSTRVSEGVLDLERRLSLPRLPMRIECIDISHLQGVDPVASLVVSVNGEPRRSEYRLFHIKNVVGIDDPASIAEVMRRRLARHLRGEVPAADLLIVDGGIAQARAAQAELAAAGLDWPVYGLAKQEEVLVPPVGEPIKLPRVSPGLRVLVRLRNEAHRFANNFRAKTAAKRFMRSALLNLPGVGPRTLQKILAAFGSLDKAANATPEELRQRADISARIAALIHAYLKPPYKEQKSDK